MNQQRTKFITALKLAIVTFLGLLAIYLGLPALFLLLRVPSFALGNESMWILRWQNDATQSGIEFNLLPLIIVAIAVSFIRYTLQRRGN
jgi:hypothetical protein